MGALPSFDTDLSYQARCGARDCETTIGMSYRFCPQCGTAIDWPNVDEGEAGEDIPRHLLTGGAR